MRTAQNLFSIVGLTLVAWSTAACGGNFKGGDDDDGGSGGQAAGGSGNAGPGGQSTGGRAGSGSGASSGTGSGGGAVGGCVWNGNSYAVGDSFPAGDGCNTCTCSNSGVGCTEAACDDCSQIQSIYVSAIEQAVTCDPLAPDPCSQEVFVGLICGCTSFVNPEHVDAIAVAQDAQQQYGERSCAGDVACEPCLPPTSAYCSAEGRCVDVYDMDQAACKLGGVVYPSGSTAIPDPFSCNTCDCFDGQLSCSEAFCPIECPPDSLPSTQCAQCGPTDGCEVVEHACLPVCEEVCENGGACIDGVCRMVCG